MANPYEPIMPDSRPPSKRRWSTRWKLLLLFVSFLILLNGWLFNTLRNASGWGVIGVLHIVAPASNLISSIVALVACIYADSKMRATSLGWCYFASVFMPLISLAVLYFLAMLLVDAHGC